MLLVRRSSNTTKPTTEQSQSMSNFREEIMSVFKSVVSENQKSAEQVRHDSNDRFKHSLFPHVFQNHARLESRLEQVESLL